MATAALVAAPDSGPDPIRVTALRKRYRRRVAVDGIDLAVRHGEIFGLIGPDGAGKSSLMKALAGVLSFEDGRAEVFGVSLDSEAAAERIKDRIGFMPQGLGLNLYPELSVEENIDFFARLRLVPAAAVAARKARLLAITRLARFRDRPMKQLSGGMKQKLGLACTLIHEPELLILDEPTTGVDPVSRRDFWAILATLIRERGTTVLVSTAYMDEASRFSRVALMYGGRVLASGTPDEILAATAGCKLRIRVTPQLPALARLKARYAQVEAWGEWLHVFVPEADAAAASAAVRAALADFALADLQPDEPDLENVFVALLQPALAAADPAARATAPAAANDTIAIEAAELTRDFGRFRAVDGVSFRVPAGEIFGLLGANGAGKTTVIKMLTGILPPTRGAGHVAGADMRTAPRAIKRRIGYVSQAFSLYTDLSVHENIRLYAGIYGLDARATRERAAWVLAMGDLAGHEDDIAGRLPVGLRQRLAIGCALLHRPQVLFLDEPTAGVDPIGRRRLWDILFALTREEGVAILVTTHYMGEAEHCDHLALLHGGRLIADAAPAALKRALVEEAGELLELAVSDPALAVERLAAGGYEHVALHGRRVHLLSRAPETDRERIAAVLAAAGLRLESVTTRPVSIEDVFVYRVGRLERAAAEAGP